MEKVRLLPYNRDKNKEIDIIEIGKKHQIDTTIQTPYRTDFYQIIWFKSGRMIGNVDFEKNVFEHNTISFLNKNKVQSYHDFYNVEADIILFTETFYNQGFSSSNHIDRNLLFSDLIQNTTIKADNPNLDAIKNLLFDEYHQEMDIFTKDILRNQLHTLVLLAEREIQKYHQLKLKSPDLDLYLNYKKILDEKYVTHKSVEYYCTQLNVTEKSLNRAIANVSGKNPKTIIHQKVILEAKWLLGNNNLSIKEVSNELGFSEPTNFVKYFKKHIGLSPTEYIKSYQA